MSTPEPEVKRWTAKRKTQLVLEILKGKTTVAEAARRHDLKPSEIQYWVDEGIRGMENCLRARPRDIREQYEAKLKEAYAALGEAQLEIKVLKKVQSPARLGRDVVKSVQAELEAEGKKVSLTKLCRWLGISRRTFYYQPKGRKNPLDEEKVARVKEVIERFPTYGYRWIAVVLGWNRKVVQRICQRKGWQVRKRSKGSRPRAKGLISVASRPNERWATDLTTVWCGRDRWCTLAVVIDCATREVVGWRLASRGNAATAEAALEEALIFRFGCLGRVCGKLVLRSDNGLVFMSKRYTATAKAYGLSQEFITLYTPEQNGLVERFIRTLKEECIWQHRFGNLSEAREVIGTWMRYYNMERPHQALGYQSPSDMLAIAA